ncbi:SPOR domain-containing protein [bacterium]|nr:SPOR domain-containing protein [bacterium]
MRFEIKSGGIVAILVGIAALSGAVFVLGLLAGYDVGRESAASQAQVAAVYPLESPPAAESSVAAAPTPAAPASRTGSAESGGGAVAPATLHPARTPGSPSSAAEESSHENGQPLEADRSSPETSSAGRAAPTPARRLAATNPPNPPARAAESRRRPYNIQIQAAMDRSGADEMVRRLENLGYSAHITPTELAGQTWYKVEVGPYATQAEAEAAQAQLRTRYNSAYGRAGGAAPSSTGTADPGD